MDYTQSLVPIPTRIVKIVNEIPSVKTYIIEKPKNYIEPKPGQFNMIYVHGVGEVPISVSDISDNTIAHTVRFVGSVTNVIKNLKEGDIVGIRGPYGKPWPIKEYEGWNILIVAGGIGLAPLRPAIKEVIKRKNKYGKLIILYGARTPKDLLYKDELLKYNEIPDVEVQLTVDRADESWKGHVGVVTKLIPPVRLDIERTVAFICGPEVMIKFTVKELIKKGLSTKRMYVSLERRMKCGVGLCGHCQLGPYFVCRHGPVFPYWLISRYFEVEEL